MKKPILILKVNVGSEYGGIIPLEVLYNDENYFRDIIEDFSKKHPVLNDESIKDVLFS